jgi:hypothetical protein
MLMKTVLLICALGMPRGDCNLETATAVVQGPDTDSFVTCGLHGQAYIAEGALAGYLEDGHYLKVTCSSGSRIRPALAPRQAASPAAPMATEPR